MRKLFVCLFALCLLAYSTSSWAASLKLTWVDASDNEANFKVERSVNGTTLSFTQIATPAMNATTYTDTTAIAGTTYAYRVNACNTAGCSAYSNIATGTALVPVPTAPSGLSVTALP